MAAGDQPAPIDSVAASEVAVVETWANGQRAELAKLTLTLRMLLAEAQAAEEVVAVERAGSGAGHSPARLAADLDAVLAKTVAHQDAVIAKAQLEAREIVAAAIREAGKLRASLDADAADGPLRPPVDLRAPIEVDDLFWQGVPAARNRFRRGGQIRAR